MTDLNVVVLEGRMTRDASEGMKTSANGVAWGSFSIAVNKGEKQSDGTWKDKAMYYDVKAFGKLYERCVPRMTKGTTVVVKGSLDQDRWEKDGQKFSKVVVIADEIYPSKGSNSNEASKGGAPKFEPKPQKTDDFQEDFPF